MATSFAGPPRSIFSRALTTTRATHPNFGKQSFFKYGRGRGLFQKPDDPLSTHGWDANGKIIFGNHPQDQSDPNQASAQPGAVTGLTPNAPRMNMPPQADSNGNVPGVAVSTFAPSGDPQAAVTARINAGQPPPDSPPAPPPPAAAGAPPAPQQTEAANPLTGDAANQPTGKTTSLPSSPAAIVAPQAPDINHAKALGFSSRGDATPSGQDTSVPVDGASADQTQQPSSYTGGTGDYQRSFTNPTSAAIYHDYVKNLFSGSGGDQGSAIPSSKPMKSQKLPSNGAPDQEADDTGA